VPHIQRPRSPPLHDPRTNSRPLQPGGPPSRACFEFPACIDSTGRYLFYLHGKIIEDQGLPAVSPEFGECEYQAILRRLQDSGAVVISEERGKGANASTYAPRIKDQVGLLKQAGVPSQHITVVGASKGAYIAALSSFEIKDPAINFVLLGSCFAGMSDDWSSSGRWLYGKVLAIHDSADGYAGSCEDLSQLSEGKGLAAHEEIVLHVGTGHGILYHPLDEWIGPTLVWAGE
jgi:hypothetical protein